MAHAVSFIKLLGARVNGLGNSLVHGHCCFTHLYSCALSFLYFFVSSFGNGKYLMDILTDLLIYAEKLGSFVGCSGSLFLLLQFGFFNLRHGGSFCKSLTSVFLFG